MDSALLELAYAYAHAAVDALIEEELKAQKDQPHEEAEHIDGN